MHILVEHDVGTSIEEAAQAMCDLADRCGCSVQCKFNGVTLRTKPRADAAELVRDFHRELSQPSEFRFAFA